jgi:hypothetical protein
LGVSWLAAIVLLGPLLGSSADSSTAYAEHFDLDANLVRDLVGSLALVIASAALVGLTVAARHDTADDVGGSLRDLVGAAGVVTASVLVVAAGLLATVPLTTGIGNLTDDPGIDSTVQAGIAQSGTVVLLVAALPLGATTVLLARLGRRSGALPRWMVWSAWISALLLVLGVSVVLLVPVAAWVLALLWTWRGRDVRVDQPPDAVPVQTAE